MHRPEIGQHRRWRRAEGRCSSASAPLPVPQAASPRLLVPKRSHWEEATLRRSIATTDRESCGARGGYATAWMVRILPLRRDVEGFQVQLDFHQIDVMSQAGRLELLQALDVRDTRIDD